MWSPQRGLNLLYVGGSKGYQWQKLTPIIINNINQEYLNGQFPLHITCTCYLAQAKETRAATRLSRFTPHRASSSFLLIFSSSLACWSQLHNKLAKPLMQLVGSAAREFGAQFWRHWSNNSEHCPAKEGSVRLWDSKIGTRRRRLTWDEKESSWKGTFGFPSLESTAGGQEFFDDNGIILDFCDCQRPSKARWR